MPLWALLAVMTALGVGFWLSALNVRYRDIRYTVPFLAQLWFFATPVVYPTSIVPPEVAAAVRAQSDGGRRRRLPLGAAREDDRARRDGRRFRSAPSCAVLLAGLFYFRRMERTFADVI